MSDDKKKRDLSKVIKKVQNSLKKDPKAQASIGLGSQLRDTWLNDNKEQGIVMPEWFREHFEVPGLEFGRIYQVAGNSDSGKTSLAIIAMKEAQDQDTDIIYVETERKTKKADLLEWGVNPESIMLIQETITENVWDRVFSMWDSYFDEFPDGKLLVIIDSYGNTVSKRDSELDMQDASKPGEAAKTNRRGLSKLIAKTQEDRVATFVVNYNYANMGSHGNTEAGGKALYFYSSIIIESARIGFLEKTQSGEKIRIGAKCRYRTKKNHANKKFKKDLVVQIDENGITPLE